MTSPETLRISLRTLTTEFPSARLRYQLDAFTQTHMVEVSPAYLYDADDNFKGAQARVIEEFVQQFPYQGLCFIGPDDVIGIEGEAEIFHGFWSELKVEPLTFAWPVDLVPAVFVKPPMSWMNVIGFDPNATIIHNPVFIQSSIPQSFMQTIPVVPFEQYDIVCVDTKKDIQTSEDPEYALAA